MKATLQIPQGVAAPFIALFLVSLFLLAGCVSSPVNDGLGGESTDVTLTNTYWKLENVASQPVPETDGEQQAHILFMDDGRVRGFSSCNEYRGEYLIEEKSLFFESISSTQRACEDNLVEEWLFTAFAKTVGVNLDGTNLLLLGEEGKTVAVFKAVQ